MTEQEIKKKVLQKLKEALQDEGYAKYFKKYKSLCDCLSKVKECDVEIIKLNVEVQKVTSFGFRADRYYRQIFSDGSLGREVKQEPARLQNSAVNFYGTIYNVKKEKPTQMEEYFYRHVLAEKRGCGKENYKDGKYIVYHGMMENDDLEDDLKAAFEKEYRRINETSLYNYPEQQTKLLISNWTFLKTETLNGLSVSPILLKIKDKKGNDIKMHFGTYDESTQELTDAHAGMIAWHHLFTSSGDWRFMRKSLFKWVL